MEWLKDQIDYYKKAFPIGIPMYLEDLKWSWNTYINNLTALGIYLTLGYVLFMVDILGSDVISWIQKKVIDDDLNEIGDFLAGLFGPIAFGWLIIGYLMQNIELKNSVSEANATNNLNRDSFNFNRLVKEYEVKKEHNDNQPMFAVSCEVRGNNNGKGEKFKELVMRITNYGYSALNVRVSRLFEIDCFSYDEKEIQLFDTVEKMGVFHVRYILDEGLAALLEPVKEEKKVKKFLVEYTDGLKKRGFITMNLSTSKDTESGFVVAFMNSTKNLPDVF